MNIFCLDIDPKICAEYHCDRHVMKMIVEYAQLLSTAHRILDGKEVTALLGSKKKIFRILPNADMEANLYKATHRNHPSAVWVRESSANYLWLYELFTNLCDVYSYRYNLKVHKTDRQLRKLLGILPKNIPLGPDRKSVV